MQDVIVDHTLPGRATDDDATILAFEYPKVPIISYAQTHEDVLLWRALHNVHRGFYIDVGAHDPTALSVTRAFYENGWRGINVEPDPLYADKLRKERPRDVTLEVALGHSPGMTTLYGFGDTGLSTLVKGIADEHIAAGFKATERSVSVTTLAELLNDLGDQQVHFLKIDVEGCEQQVLRGADFAKVRPWIVLIEATRPLTTIATWEGWEPLLLKAGYEFVYFDGLNRFYVADEHRHLKRYFSVPVSTCDPFRDGEVVRLSAVISGLQRDLIKHEVPRLGNSDETPIACDAHNAAGLLQIVEAQASDLVRLRRALLSAQTVASLRLRAIRGDANESKFFEWSRSFERSRSGILQQINRTQGAISDVIERSRWRRIGQQLGLAKRMAWETGSWRTDFSVAGITGSADGGTSEPSMAELRSELERLYGLLDELRRSRWQKLGHRLGLARRLPWESEGWHDPLMSESSPQGKAGSRRGEHVSAVASPSSYIKSIQYTVECFLRECRGFATDVILDIGANTGQFAEGLRACGYHGHIVSFEPLSDAHARLVAAAASDPLWDVAERCAAGARDGWTNINIAGNSYSSSLLPMLDLYRDAALESAYLGTEPCRVITLDSYIEQTCSDPTTLFGLKIDTQGYEAQVLEGLKRHHDRVKVIVCAMSLVPLYADAPCISELCHLLAELGYRCVAFGPGFEDRRSGELLQVDGIFVKRG
jgi:FkbM family methyltransferase